MSPKFILFFAVSIGLVAISKCYPYGAPAETCKMFTANHTGHTPQNSKSKYEISVSPSKASPGKYTVKISGDTFKGFFIKAEVANTKKIAGQFKPQTGVSQTRDCERKPASASTHVEGKDKTAVSLEWSPDASARGNTVVFKAVIVKTYEMFWNNVVSKPIHIS